LTNSTGLIAQLLRTQQADNLLTPFLLTTVQLAHYCAHQILSSYYDTRQHTVAVINLGTWLMKHMT